MAVAAVCGLEPAASVFTPGINTDLWLFRDSLPLSCVTVELGFLSAG